MCWLYIAVIVLVPYECNPMSVPLRHVATKPNFWSIVCSTKARKIRRGPFFQENSTLFLTGDEVQRTSSLFSSNRNAMHVINFCWWYASNCDWFSFQVTCKKKKTLSQCERMYFKQSLLINSSHFLSNGLFFTWILTQVINGRKRRCLYTTINHFPTPTPVPWRHILHCERLFLSSYVHC